MPLRGFAGFDFDGFAFRVKRLWVMVIMVVWGTFIVVFCGDCLLAQWFDFGYDWWWRGLTFVLLVFGWW